MTTRNRRVLLSAIVVALTASCATPAGTARTPVPSLSDLAERYVRLTLQFAEHDPALVDRWLGRDDWRPGPREPVAVLRSRLDGLQRDLQRQSPDVGQTDRAGYLAAQLNALRLIGERLSGQSEKFAIEAERALGAPPSPVDASLIERARAGLERELPGRGSLADRYEAYRRRLVVPSARVESVMRLALDACRAATSARIALPADERVEVTRSGDFAWDAYARYVGHHVTRLELNRHAQLDVTRALRLACHEGYPGHHVQNIWIDDELVRGRQWPEFELTPSFGRHLLVTEGAAEAGVGLAMPDAARETVYRRTLFRAAGIEHADAARLVRIENLIGVFEPLINAIIGAYLDNDLTEAVAAERLRHETLTPDPKALLSFAERYRTRALAYSEGRRRVAAAVGDAGIAGLHRVFVDHPFAVQ